MNQITLVTLSSPDVFMSCINTMHWVARGAPPLCMARFIDGVERHGTVVALHPESMSVSVWWNRKSREE